MLFNYLQKLTNTRFFYVAKNVVNYGQFKPEMQIDKRVKCGSHNKLTPKAELDIFESN